MTLAKSRMIRALSGLLVSVAIVSACARTSTPAALVQARTIYQSLVNTDAERRVEGPLIRTREAIRVADSASASSGQEYADALAHIALRTAQSAEAENAQKIAQSAADSLRTARLTRLLTLTQAQRDALAQRNQLSQEEIASLRERNVTVTQRADSLRSEAQMAQMRADSLRRVAEEANTRLNAALMQLRTLIVEITNLQQTSRGLVVSLSDVLFDVNKATLKSGNESKIRQIAAVLQQYPDNQITVEGHTDSQGSDAYNQRLSEQRAASVRSSLVAGGIDPNKISSRGLGESQPVATNDTPSGRQQNRRVEIIVEGAGKVGDVQADSTRPPPN